MRQRPHKKWKFETPDLDKSAKLAAELDVPLLVGQLLVKRGIEKVSDAKSYLYPNFNGLFEGVYKPSKLADMDKAVERINRAKKLGEKICVYGDYDADGTTATALLLNSFRQMNIPAEYYIPNRFKDGYGLSKETVKEVRKNGVQLLITVDCGITSKAEVELANNLDMDVIITDHHQPDPKNSPPAHALISPKVPGSEYHYQDLAGVGLAFKLAQELIDKKNFLMSLLDLVVLGTVVDLVPLTGENRILSRLGLDELNKRKRPGINALCEVAGYATKPLVGHSLSFGLGPRINAAGRMSTAQRVVELLKTDDHEIAMRIASKLDEENRSRRELEASIHKDALYIINKKKIYENKTIVVHSDQWPEQAKGVVGIVASRLLERYYKPVFVIVVNKDEATGSGRCVEGMNLADSLNSCRDLLIKHGGHAAAAGLTLKTKNLSKFKEVFEKYASDNLSDDALQPKFELDFETNLSVLTPDVLEKLEQFEPFGRENNPPYFCAHRLRINGTPNLMGKEKQHLSMFVSDGATNLRAIAWQAGEEFVTFKGPKKSLDIAFSPEINEWQGTRSTQLILQDWKIRSDNREGKHNIYPPSDVSSVAKVVDGRNKNKRDYLLNLLKENESCIIYVQNSEMLGLLLTRLLPEKADSIARYDDMMSGQETELLKKLKHGELQSIATNATFPKPEELRFVKHFVFCHLTTSADEFRKRCKPAFTSEEIPKIHLIYNDSDITLMNNWISQKYPEDVILREFYRNLRYMVETNGTEEILENEILNGALGDPITVKIGLAIFEELQFIERFTAQDKTLIKLLPAEKRELSQSIIYVKEKLKKEWIKQTSQYFAEFQLQQDIKPIWERVKDECGIPN